MESHILNGLRIINFGHNVLNAAIFKNFWRSVNEEKSSK